MSFKIWDAQTGEILYEGKRATVLALSPDNQYVAGGTSWEVEIYAVTDLLENSELAE